MAIVRDSISGFGLFFEGFSLLRRNRALWPLATVPLVLCVLLVSGALTAVFWNAGAVHALSTAWEPRLVAEAWYQWLWVAPARALFALLSGLLFALVAAVAVVAGLLVANIAAAPFLDALSQRVERLESGSVVEAGEGGLSAILADAGRSVMNELRRVAFFAAIWLALFAIGVFVPGAQLVTPFVLAAFTLLFLPLDYAGPLLDRRRIPFRARRAWVRRELPAMAGFGGAAFLICLVPGLNFLMLPVLVVGGTLLALRRPPAQMLSALER